MKTEGSQRNRNLISLLSEDIMREEKKPRYSSMLVIKTNPQTIIEVKNVYYLFSQTMAGSRAERVVKVFGKAV